MKIKIELEERLKQSIFDITMSEYETVEDLEGLLWDLVCSYEALKEEFEDYKQIIADNYKRITPSEQYGISDEDFI